MSDNLATMEIEVKALKKEAKNRKKMLAVQQKSMFEDKDFRDFRKCSLCPKVFVNESFLSSHMRRRHKEFNQESNTHMSQSNLLDKTNRGELLELLQDLKSDLNLPKAKPNDFTFIFDLVKTQQEQINQLQANTRIQDRQETGNNNDVKTEPEGSRLQAQELFWQSKIKTLEETFAKSLLESEEKLNNLKTEFENEKQKMKKKKRKKRKTEIVEAEEEQEISKTKPGEGEPKNPVSEDSQHQYLAKTEVSEVERKILQTDNISLASQEEHSELFNENKIDQTKTNNNERNESFPIRKTVSSISLKSEHMYEAPLSFRSSKENILELIDKNPSKIDQYRSQVKSLLSDQLDQLGVDSQAWKMSDEDFSGHMRQIKDYRGRLSNSSEIRVLRSQYREEVEALASQSSLKHNTIRSRLSKGMSSFRKQIFRSLQNLNSSKQQHKSPPTEIIKKKKSPKKKLAPSPPVFKRVSSSESAKLDTQNNIYVDSPVRLPPKPAPRASKVAESFQKCEIPSSSSSSEDEFEEHIDIEQHGNIKINTIVVHRNNECEDNDTIGEVENLSENKSITNNELETEVEDQEEENEENEEEEEEEEEERDEVDRTFDANDTDVEDEDRTFSWDSEENIAEIENVGPQEVKVAEEIKLAKPRPGSKIADLTNIIESQLHRRAARPAGGVDPLQAAMERCELEEVEVEEVEGGTDISTNTLATSQWQDSRPCSATTFPSVSSRPVSGRLVPHRRTITSWDLD